MSLLSDIQKNAISDETPTTVVLRQCTLLAARLKHDPLRVWAARELEGYPADAQLPPYRKRFATMVLGDFSGPMGSGMKNAELPPGLLPEQLDPLRESLYFAETREGVAEIEELLGSGEHTFQVPWPGDVVVAVQGCYYEHMALMRAWQVIPASALRSAISGIRDRVLQFAIDIEREAPDAGEAAGSGRPIAEPVVSQIFNQNFYGDTTFAAAGHDVSQTVSHQSLDLGSLDAALAGLGIPESERADVIDAIEGDEAEPGARPGPRTRRWLERLESQAVPVATGVTTSTVAAVVLHALGLN